MLPLDVGNQVRRFGRQAEIKFDTTVGAMHAMGYQAVGFGPHDLRQSIGELAAAVISDQNRQQMFVSCNVNVLGFAAKFKIVDIAGKKVGITAVLGRGEQARIVSDDLIMSPPETALHDILPELKAQQCDLFVLLAYASLAESKALAHKFPEFDVVVTAGGGTEPPLEPEILESSDTILIQVGEKGMYVGALGVFDDASQPLRYERIPLDKTWRDSRDMLDRLAAYQDQLRTLYAQGLAGLGLRTVVHPSGQSFVGSAVCGDCHTTAHDIWAKTPHAHATETLVHPPERFEIPRHFDPECLSCHVTGWDAQGFFPYRSGYTDLHNSRSLHGNGCENCHGPGSEHVAAEIGDLEATDEQLILLRRSMQLPLSEAEARCLECHDLDNSPDFHDQGAFDSYWQKIEHRGKE